MRLAARFRIVATIVGGIALCLPALLYWDIPLAYFFHQYNGTIFHRFSSIATHAGDSIWSLTPSLAIWIIFWKLRRDIARGAMFVFLSVASSGIVVNLIKITLNRSRPPLLLESEVYGFSPLGFHTDYLHCSFPSGHAATAVGLGTALGLLFPRFQLLFWIAGCGVALSRLAINAHFFSDVVAGGCLGALASFFLFEFLYRKTSQSQLLSSTVNQKNFA